MFKGSFHFRKGYNCKEFCKMSTSPVVALCTILIVAMELAALQIHSYSQRYLSEPTWHAMIPWKSHFIWPNNFLMFASTVHVLVTWQRSRMWIRHAITFLKSAQRFIIESARNFSPGHPRRNKCYLVVCRFCLCIVSWLYVCMNVLVSCSFVLLNVCGSFYIPVCGFPWISTCLPLK